LVPVLFLPFNYRELSVVVKMGSYFSLSDGVLRHIVEEKHSRHLMLMQIVDHIAEHFIWGSKQYASLYGSSQGSGDVSF
jgi:hypothetical protein